MLFCAEQREVLRFNPLCTSPRFVSRSIGAQTKKWLPSCSSPPLLFPRRTTPRRTLRFEPAKERPATALLHSRRATQNHPNGRILDQYALRRLTACLVDLTSIPDGQRIKSWCPDWADFHFLRNPGSRDPYIHVTVTNLVALWVGECFCCRDGQYQ